MHQVLCDRHFGGINYPVGGVGGIAKSLANGLVEQGSDIQYRANVTNIILENGKAVSRCHLINRFLFRAWPWELFCLCLLPNREGRCQVVRWKAVLR